MRRFLIGCMVIGLTGSALLLAVDAPAKKPETPASQPTTKPSGPINKFCPIERDHPVDDTVPTVTFEGKVIGFCCEDCVPVFKKNPKKYMKDLK